MSKFADRSVTDFLSVYGLIKKQLQKKRHHYFHENLKNAKNDTQSINVRLLQFWGQSVSLIDNHKDEMTLCSHYPCSSLMQMRSVCRFKRRFSYFIKEDSYENKVVDVI